MTARFLATVLAQPWVRTPLITECFSVDATPLEACASTKSFRREDGSQPQPGTQWQAGPPRPEVQQRHARLHAGPGRHAVPQTPGTEVQPCRLTPLRRARPAAQSHRADVGQTHDP